MIWSRKEMKQEFDNIIDQLNRIDSENSQERLLSIERHAGLQESLEALNNKIDKFAGDLNYVVEKLNRNAQVWVPRNEDITSLKVHCTNIELGLVEKLRIMDKQINQKLSLIEHKIDSIQPLIEKTNYFVRNGNSGITKQIKKIQLPVGDNKTKEFEELKVSHEASQEYVSKLINLLSEEEQKSINRGGFAFTDRSVKILPNKGGKDLLKANLRYTPLKFDSGEKKKRGRPRKGVQGVI